MTAKTKILLDENITAYSEIHRDLLISRMRTANTGGSCVVRAFLDEGLTQEIYINVNMIIYVQSIE